MSVSLNASKLKEITNANPTSTVTMLTLAMRERNARGGDTSLSAVRNQLTLIGEKIEEGDYIAFWKNLESAGVGQYVVGRRGKPTRFKWAFPLKDVAHLAIEGKESDVKQLEAKKEQRVIIPRKKRSKRASKPAKTLKRAPKRKRLSSEDAAKMHRVMEAIKNAMLG